MRLALRRGSLYILLAALLVGTLWRGAYFPTPPDEVSFTDVFNTPRWSMVALLLLAGAWELVAAAVERTKRVFMSPLLWLFGAYTLYSGATYFWSDYQAVTVKEFLLLLAFASVLLVVRGQVLRFTGRAASSISWWLVYTGGFISLWGIVTYIVRLAPYANEVDGIYRAGGTLEYSNALGCFALMALPFAAALMARDRKDDRLLLATGMTVLTAAIILSLSRSSIVLLVLVALYLLIVNRGSIRFVLVGSSLAVGAVLAVVSLLAAEAGWSTAGVIVVVVLLLLAYLAQNYLLGIGEQKALRITYAGGGVMLAAAAMLAGSSARARNIAYTRFGEGFTWKRLMPHREDTWTGALEAFRERPLGGWGLGSFSQVYPEFAITSFTKYAHNLVLQAAVESGVIGAVLMALLLLYVIVLSLLRLLRHANPLSRAAAVATLVFIAFNVFDWEWYVPALAAWFMVMAALVDLGEIGGADAPESAD